MFQKKTMSVGDWWLFWIIMIIPLVNIYFFFVILLSSNINKSLQNYVRAMILPLIIGFAFAFAFGLFATMLQGF